MGNFLDRVVSSIAPSWGLNRERARVALKMIRSYEGASKGKRFANWKTARKENLDTIYKRDGETLKIRARDLAMNNGWAKSGLREYLDSLVGTGLRVKFFKDGKVIDDYDRIWRVWTQKKFCDYEGSKTLGAMERLAASARYVDGECFIRKITGVSHNYARDSSMKLPPFSIQLLGNEMLDTNKKEASIESNKVRAGVEYDNNNRIVGYWFFEKNPLEARSESVLINADEVSHIKADRFIGQVRGVTEFDAAIKILKDTDEMEEAVLLQRKMSACMMGFLKDVEYNEDGSPQYVIPDKVEPATIAHLPPGASVDFITPPVVSDFKDVALHHLHKIAGSLGLSYSGLTKDVSQVNYSSLRGSRNTELRSIAIDRKLFFAPQFIEVIADWFLEFVTAPPEVYAIWMPPPVLMIDPEKEGKAYTDLVRSGFHSLSEVAEFFGKDPKELLSEIENSNKTLDELGIVLDSDPRKTTKNGQMQSIDQPDA